MMKHFCDDWILFWCKVRILFFVIGVQMCCIYMILGPFILSYVADALETESDACVEDDTRARGFAQNKFHQLQAPAYIMHTIMIIIIIKIHTTLIRLPQKHREEYFKSSIRLRRSVRAWPDRKLALYL